MSFYCSSHLALSLLAIFSLQDNQGICAANQNGSQAECKLGNPFRKDAEVNNW